jgi:hypothetical protein
MPRQEWRPTGEPPGKSWYRLPVEPRSLRAFVHEKHILLSAEPGDDYRLAARILKALDCSWLLDAGYGHTELLREARVAAAIKGLPSQSDMEWKSVLLGREMVRVLEREVRERVKSIADAMACDGRQALKVVVGELMRRERDVLAAADMQLYPGGANYIGTQNSWFIPRKWTPRFEENWPMLSQLYARQVVSHLDKQEAALGEAGVGDMSLVAQALCIWERAQRQEPGRGR